MIFLSHGMETVAIHGQEKNLIPVSQTIAIDSTMIFIVRASVTKRLEENTEEKSK